MMQTEKDSALVLQFRSGDKSALSELVKRWHKEFCKKAYWLVKDRDAAKDIAQDTWGVIINKIDALEDIYSFRAWAMRIVYNKSLDWLKVKSKTKKQLFSYHNKLDEIEEEDNYNEDVLKRSLKMEIKRLPIKQQMVIKLFYIENYSLKQISDQLNISVGTSKSRLFHAREKLRIVLIKKRKKL